MVCVFHGCALVLARDFRFIRPLIRDDFPTFDFPANATSGLLVSGSLLVIPHTISNDTFLITIDFLSFFTTNGQSLLTDHLFYTSALLSTSFIELTKVMVSPSVISLSNS